MEAPGQGHLFGFDVDESVAVLPEPPARRPGRRRGHADHASRITIDCLKSESHTTCPKPRRSARTAERPRHASARMRPRVLQFIPARFELQIHVLPKYACSHCRDGVVAPEGPPRPLSGCIAGAGVLAEVVVSKFAEHLPHYRFEDISTRYGLYLPRSTLCDWVRNVADLLKPLYQLQKDLVRMAPVIWTDDTYVTFLGGEGPGSRKGRFWVYIGPTAFPYDVYDFTEDRKRDGPSRFLASYVGYLQADAFSGYDGIYAGSGGQIIEVACSAHAASEVFRGAVIVSRGSFTDSADDSATLRSRGSGSASGRHRSARAASGGVGADLGAAPG